MIEDYYFRFIKITHSQGISMCLSYLARFVFFLRFLLRRCTLKKENVELTKEQAIVLLQETSPEPKTEPDYDTVKPDWNIDLSIIVPVYNHIDILKRCIDSLIDQETDYIYELILVDDGSTDGAQILVDEYDSYENVSVIHQKNGGIAAARNTGLSYARGKYLMFVDCDDYVHEDLVESLLKKAEENDADIVMCAHALVKLENGIIVSRLPNIYPMKYWISSGDGAEIMNYAGLPWGKVYRRELFEKVRFFPGYWYEDTIIASLIYTQCKKFIYLPKIKYEYQWSDSNFSHIQGGKRQKKAIDRYWLLKAILKHYDEIGLQKDNKFYIMLLRHLSVYYYPTIASLSDDVIEAMFIAGRELLLQYKPKDRFKLPYMLGCTEKAIIEKDIALWKLCSLNQ